MSRGLGKIGRVVEAAFAAEPDNAFTVDELCHRAYPGINRIEKRHRVAVLHAAKKRPNTDWRPAESLGGMLVFYIPDNVMSYAMGRLKMDRCNCGYWERSRTSDTELAAQLHEGGDYHEYIIEDGAWWCHVEMFKAQP